jgi:hypothetical protein
MSVGEASSKGVTLFGHKGDVRCFALLVIRAKPVGRIVNAQIDQNLAAYPIPDWLLSASANSSHIQSVLKY